MFIWQNKWAELFGDLFYWDPTWKTCLSSLGRPPCNECKCWHLAVKLCCKSHRGCRQFVKTRLFRITAECLRCRNVFLWELNICRQNQIRSWDFLIELFCLVDAALGPHLSPWKQLALVSKLRQRAGKHDLFRRCIKAQVNNNSVSHVPKRSKVHAEEEGGKKKYLLCTHTTHWLYSRSRAIISVQSSKTILQAWQSVLKKRCEEMHARVNSRPVVPANKATDACQEGWTWRTGCFQLDLPCDIPRSGV